MTLGMVGVACGQAVPAATVSGPRYNPGPALPAIDGNFQYSLSAADSVQLGYGGNGGTSDYATLSGTVEYLSPSEVRPFSILYGGGFLYSTYPGQGAGTFQSLTVTQGFVGHRWAVGASDSVSYLPQSPTTGLLGVAGVGSIGLQPAPNPSAPSQSVLTNYARQVMNVTSGNIERQLSGRTSISGTGSYGILRFIDNNGLDGTQIGGQVGLNRQLDRRSSASLTAVYTSFTFGGNASSFNARGINVGYTRQLSKAVNMSLSAGPQLISGFQEVPLANNFAIVSQPRLTTTISTIPIPASTNFAANASLSYVHKYTTASIGYVRGVTGGAGLQIGANMDTVSLGLQRTYGRNWSTGLTAGYMRTTALGIPGTTTGFIGGVQASRRISNSFSAFASYTALDQSVSSALATQNAFNGVSHIFSFGITYAPRMVRLGQF